MDIVKVKYFYQDGEQLSPWEYTYFSEDNLNVGDIVNVPVRDTIAKAQVSAVNIPEESISAYRDKVKTITSNSVILKEKEPEHKETVIPMVDDINLPEDEVVISRALPVGTALINIAPGEDQAVRSIYLEAQTILTIAESRIIKSNEDAVLATEDLSLIKKLTKAITDKKVEYVKPIKDRLDGIVSAFKLFMAPLEEAEKITKGKILSFRQEQERKIREVEEIERQKLELAQREAALNHGEITIDLTPIEKPESPPDRIRTEIGTAGTMKVRKWEVIDFSLLPDEYKLPDAGKITKLVKAGIGAIPGLRIWVEDTLSMRTK